jgi:hypothetical protein
MKARRDIDLLIRTVHRCAQCHRVMEIGTPAVRTRKGITHQHCPLRPAEENAAADSSNSATSMGCQRDTR